VAKVVSQETIFRNRLTSS